jgi:hypothetical protein
MGAAKLSAVLRGHGAATRLPLGGTFTGNGTNVIGLAFTTIDADTIFRDPGVPYLQQRDVNVTQMAKVSFEAGVDYRMAVDTSLEIGWAGSEATIVANGTTAKPVNFGRASETAGMFQSIIIGPKVRSDSVLTNVKIAGGGNGGAALHLRGPIKIDTVALDGNQTGLTIEGPGFVAGSKGLSITKTMGHAATVEPNNAVTLPKGGTFLGNMRDWIVLKRGTYSMEMGTLPNLGVPYRVEGDILTQGMSSLTIEPGTNFVMAADASIEFGWAGGEATITAVGSAENPIVFKGSDDVVGYWEGLIVNRNVRSSSKLAFVHVVNGGKAGGAALRLRKAAFDVTNSKFAKSAGLGIGKPSDDPTDYAAGGNTFEMNAGMNVGAL